MIEKYCHIKVKCVQRTCTALACDRTARSKVVCGGNSHLGTLAQTAAAPHPDLADAAAAPLHAVSPQLTCLAQTCEGQLELQHPPSTHCRMALHAFALLLSLHHSALQKAAIEGLLLSCPSPPAPQAVPHHQPVDNAPMPVSSCSIAFIICLDLCPRLLQPVTVKEFV